ncbi:hypothetical protein [Methylobacterium aquaticum]|uniref:Uncharacterized protein n=1 Tax=Methylobacterium aquaticum TaxID=270351 RepID=A0A0J6SM18_9HYPH|nr:hypothetical protein [Methylobacterium aquaticum]KMO34709.1 hypothetical protein VP06_13665 [Methylobacterium aquaticum]
MATHRERLDLGMPEHVQTPEGEKMTVAGLIELARTAGTDRGNDLYDAFSEAWHALAGTGLSVDARANLAYEAAAEEIDCPIQPDGIYLPH